MPSRFDKFIHDENIKSLIETETDSARLTMLKTLLREEQVRGVSQPPIKLP